MNKKQKIVLWRIIITAALFALLEVLQRWGPLSALPTWAKLVCYLVPYGVIAYDVVGKALRNLRTGAVFQKEQECYWVCRICGALHKGRFAPLTCAVCGYPQSCFSLYAEDY